MVASQSKLCDNPTDSVILDAQTPSQVKAPDNIDLIAPLYLRLYIKSKLDNNYVITTAFRSDLPNFYRRDPLPGNMVLEFKALEGGVITGTTIPGGELEYKDL